METQDHAQSKRMRSEHGRDFVDSHEQQRPSKRTSRACENCRSKKIRCDGGRPACLACVTAGVQCTVGAKARKRGLPTGYVRILETLWALVFEAVPGAADTTTELLRTAGVIMDDDERVALRSSLVPSGESLRQIWSDSTVRVEIDRLIGEIEKSEQLGQHGRRTILDGAARPTERTSLANTPSWIVPHEPFVGNLSLETSHSRVTGWDADCQGPQHVASSVLPGLSEDPWALLDIYLTYSNCCFPIIPKHQAVRILSKHQDGTACHPAETALLWAVFALASSMKLDSRSGTSHYYRAALRLIPQDDESLSPFYFASALLLLGQSKMELGEWKVAYLVIGQAVRILLLQRCDPDRGQWDKSMANMSDRSLLGLSFWTLSFRPTLVLVRTCHRNIFVR